MKQTAVEWFAKEVLNARQLGFISNEKFNDLLNQAKTLEKEQIKDAFEMGQINVYENHDIDSDDYYQLNF